MTEKTRGTMLTSSAVIISLATFVIGFVCGGMVAEHRAVRQEKRLAAVDTLSGVDSSAAFPDEHIRHLRKEAEQHPDNAKLWAELGNACFDAGKAEEAIEAYQNALRIEPGNADVRTDMGSMYRMKGDPEKAINCYDQVLMAYPDHKNAVFNKGVTLLLDREQPEQAVSFWKSVLKKAPDFTLSSGAELKALVPELLVDAAFQLESRGRKDPALRAYRQAWTWDENFLPALIHGAYLLEGMGRSSEAEPLWKRVLALQPDATDPAGRFVRDHIVK